MPPPHRSPPAAGPGWSLRPRDDFAHRRAFRAERLECVGRLVGRVAVLHSGGVAQLGTPSAVYTEPADLTVARLTGPVSVLVGAAAEPGAVAAGPLAAAGAAEAGAVTKVTIAVGGGQATVPCSVAPGADVAGGRAAILVRPDWAVLDGDGDLPGEITEVRFRGPFTDYEVGTQHGAVLIRESGPPRHARGPVRWSLRHARLIPPDQPP